MAWFDTMVYGASISPLVQEHGSIYLPFTYWMVDLYGVLNGFQYYFSYFAADSAPIHDFQLFLTLSQTTNFRLS